MSSAYPLVMPAPKELCPGCLATKKPQVGGPRGNLWAENSQRIKKRGVCARGFQLSWLEVS